MRVNANELAGCPQCGPAGLACGFPRCGKTAGEAVALVGPGGSGGVVAWLPPGAGTGSWLSGTGSTAQPWPQVEPSQWGFIDSRGR